MRVDLHLRGNFRDCFNGVVLRKCVFMENDPFWQPQLVRLGPVAGERVNESHVLVCQNEVVSRSVHISSDLNKSHCSNPAALLGYRFRGWDTDVKRLHTCMKNPASRALLMLWVLVLVPKEASEMGSSILFRVSVSSERTASAVFRDEYTRKLSWHHFSGLESSKQPFKVK